MEKTVTIEIRTVGDLQKCVARFPHDWPLLVSTKGGGAVVAEHRQTSDGNDFVAVYNDNGGRFGENPLTEEEYRKESEAFLREFNDPYYSYTSIHGDHRMYHPSGMNDTCYGTHYDRRVVERMVSDGLIPADRVDIERVRKCHG
jgi:pyocin large subunit-like protein